MIARNQTSSSRFVCIVLAVFVVLCVNERALSQTEHVRLELSIIGSRDIETTDERSDAVGRDRIWLANGRPLALRVELRNESADRSVVVPAIDPRFGSIQFETRFEAADWVPVSVLEWNCAGDVSLGQRALAPGDSIVWELALEDRLASKRESGFTKTVEQYLFDELGEYQLRASLDFRWPIELQVVSNVASVEVVERRGWGWWVAGLGVVAATASVLWWMRCGREKLGISGDS